MKPFKKVAIIGVGLIGGSIGLALKKKKLAAQIVGLARKESTLKNALKFKSVDKATRNLSQALKGADLIILCQPVEAIIKSMPIIGKLAEPGSIIIDAGSCKEKIVMAAQKFLPKKVFFVGCHPLAGSEKRGVQFASSELFKDSVCVLTPTSQTNKKALKTIREFWQKLGAEIIILKPDAHDNIVAFISHLPHMLAFSLINAIPSEYLKLSSTGLKDTTRIACSSPEIWRDICLCNSKAILKSVNRFESVLKALKRQIIKKDSAALKKSFQKSQKKRNRLNAN